MKKAFPILMVLVPVFIAYEALGQNMGPSWLDFESDRLNINSFGMALLTIWAAVNILTGIPGWIFGKGVSRYFFQMNAFWNLVNLGLGLAGYMGAANADMALLTQGGITAAYHDMQNLYILNTGLDVAYIAIAFLLIERAKRILKWRHLLRGYGFSLIVQGGFLLIFDLIMFFVHKSHATQYLYPIIS
jgi:hypothetical protein